MKTYGKRSAYLIVSMLLLALAAAPAYAVACPIVCQLAESASGSGRMPMYGNARCQGKHCPMCHPSRAESPAGPASGPVNNCSAHCSAFAVVIPAAVSIHLQAAAASVLAARIPSASPRASFLAAAYHSPPALLLGADASRFTSILRV